MQCDENRNIHKLMKVVMKLQKVVKHNLKSVLVGITNPIESLTPARIISNFLIKFMSNGMLCIQPN